MSALLQIAVALIAIWGLVWFVRRMFRVTIRDETTPGGREGSELAGVGARTKPRPLAGAGAVKLEEPDDES